MAKKIQGNKTAILSFSGGIISSTYLLNLLTDKNYNKVYALFFNYDNSYAIEKSSADEVVKYIESLPLLSEKLEYNKLSIRINEKASNTISNIKDSDKVSNKELFLNIDALVSLAEQLIDNDEELNVDIHLGLHDELDDDTKLGYSIALSSTEDRLGDNISVKSLYENATKQTALNDGVLLTAENKLDFNEFYKRTNTTPRTVKIGNRLFADITDPKSTERVFAFYQLNMKDPVKYAKDGVPLTWEEVMSYFNAPVVSDEHGHVSMAELEVVEVEKQSVEIKQPTQDNQPRQYTPKPNNNEPAFEPESPHKRRVYNQGIK